ncbi:MAG: glycosyltransferase family 4 protein [Chloroherpetonaceae bacterium]
MKFPVHVLYTSHFDHARMGGQKSLLTMIEHLDRSKVKPFAAVPAEGELSHLLRQLDCPTFIVPFEELRRTYLWKRWLPESRRFFHNAKLIRSLIRQHRLHVLHPDEERDVVLCGYAKTHTSTKLVYHVRLTNPTKFDRMIERVADALIGVSEGAIARFPQFMPSKKRIIFDGVDFSRFQPIDDQAKLRDELHLPIDAFILLFVGQVKAGKGIFDLLNAMKLLKLMLPESEQPLLLIAGLPIDEHTLPEVQTKIQQENLNARYLGHRADVHRLMQACDVLTLPSHEGVEGLPRVIVEAMACGAVALGTDTSGLREAIMNGHGVMVPEKSPDAIARAILDLMQNADLRRAYQAKGLACVKAHFDVQRNTDAVVAFYEEIL